MSSDTKPLYHFWQPRYWPAWLGLGLLRLVVMLPQNARMACGRAVGRLLHRLIKGRRDIVRRNLEICFPELSAKERARLELRTFESIGMNAVEHGMARWCSEAEVKRLVKLDGLENIQTALAEGRGVLMLSGHFASAEFVARRLAIEIPPIAAMYRPSKNPFTDQVIRRFRGATVQEFILKSGVRELIRLLRDERPIWYAFDQAARRKGSVVVNFFGEPAVTTTSVSQIARISKAPVVMFLPTRLEDGKGYELELRPALENFPTEDMEADTQRLNQLLEAHILTAPEQYHWVHRRFKGRPDLSDPY